MTLATFDRIPIRTAMATCALVLALAACASRDTRPREPIRLDLLLHASAGVNPDGRGRAAPIVVRIYELKDDTAFNEADFFSLHEKDRSVLAAELVRRDQFELRPDARERIERVVDPAAASIGILAEYRDLPNSVWRATYRLPFAPERAWYRLSSPKVDLTVELDANAIRVTNDTEH